MTPGALLPLLAAALFGIVSGFNDGGNLIGSFTSGRIISPRSSAMVLLACVAGPLVVGTAVARTVGSSVVDLHGQGSVGFMLVTLVPLAVILVSWRVGIPSSMTLALLGAMLGWVAVSGRPDAIHWSGVARVLLGMPISVLGGGLLALTVYASIRRLLGQWSNASIISLARWQLVTAPLQAFAYGSNDMEKTVGLIAVGGTFFQAGSTATYGLVSIVAGFVLFYAGAMVGGWRVARRIGFGVVKVRPAQALAQQLASGAVVSALALAGAPVSMTQTIDGGLVGVGAAARASAIRWGIVREMVGSWLIALPSAALAAASLHVVLRLAGVVP